MTLGKAEAIRLTQRFAGPRPVIFTTGFASRVGRATARDDARHFYMLGSMGLAGAIAQGFALVAQQTTFVVDGDGALLMNPTVLFPPRGARPVPVIHVVLDDGAYQSTGSQPTPEADIGALARAGTYDVVDRVETADALYAALAAASARLPRHSLVHCVVYDDLDNLTHYPRVADQLSSVARSFAAR